MYGFRFQPDDDESQPTQPKTTIKSIFRDFTTKPIPLPIWLWNLIVIAIYLSVIVFAIQISLALLAGIILGIISLFSG